MTDDYHIRKAGDDLVEFSRNFGEEEVRSLTELLFPSIYLASKRMSARAISRWLEDNQKIKFSAASVAKALRNQERYFQKIAERVQPLAEHIAHICGVHAEELLTEKTPPIDILLDQEELKSIDPEHYYDARSFIESTANQLREEWFSLDREIRFRSLSYFDFTSDDDGDEDGNH